MQIENDSAHMIEDDYIIVSSTSRGVLDDMERTFPQAERVMRWFGPDSKHHGTYWTSEDIRNAMAGWLHRAYPHGSHYSPEITESPDALVKRFLVNRRK